MDCQSAALPAESKRVEKPVKYVPEISALFLGRELRLKAKSKFRMDLYVARYKSLFSIRNAKISRRFLVVVVVCPLTLGIVRKTGYSHGTPYH